jgi:hypothetical protein
LILHREKNCFADSNALRRKREMVDRARFARCDRGAASRTARAFRPGRSCVESRSVIASAFARSKIALKISVASLLESCEKARHLCW